MHVFVSIFSQIQITLPYFSLSLHYLNCSLANRFYSLPQLCLNVSKYQRKHTMMTVSPLHDSSGTLPYKQVKRRGSTLEKAKDKQSTWEKKRSLVVKRLMDLDRTDKNEESTITKTPIPLHSPKESPTNDDSSSVRASSSSMKRAEEIQANLPLRFPSFVKLMLKSHVSGGFWLGLPKKFCDAHLPEHDETIVLVDENDDKYNTMYLANKNGLSGGWRGFSIAHNLLAEDVLVFQLIDPFKFKVHIVRARSLTEVDGATSLENPNFDAEPIIKEEDVLITDTVSDECVEIVPADNDQNEDARGLAQPRADSDDSSSETRDVIRFSEFVLSFKYVKCFEDFNIHVDGLIIDSEIPLHLRKKYYKLCRSQSMFLHENLLQGLNTKLAAGVISETINIADAVRAAKPSTGTDHLQSWGRTLKAFEDLGMVVGFLHARIEKLLTLDSQIQEKIELKRTERAEAEGEVQSLIMKLSDARMRIKSLVSEIDRLAANNDELGHVFSEVASAPW